MTREQAISMTRPSWGHRTRAGWQRLFSGPVLPAYPNKAPFERPLVVLIAAFVPALILMFHADQALGEWMVNYPEALRPFADRVTRLGEGVEVLVSTGMFLLLSALAPVWLVRKRLAAGLDALTSAAAFVFFAVAGGGLTALISKYLIGRARPVLLDSHDALSFQPFAFNSDFSSFPSGHSATAGAMAIALALVFPRLRVLFITLGMLICVSRQFVGVHWMSDTLMGWAVGAAFTYWLAHVFARRRLMFTYDGFGRLRPLRLRLRMTRLLRRRRRA